MNSQWKLATEPRILAIGMRHSSKVRAIGIPWLKLIPQLRDQWLCNQVAHDTAEAHFLGFPARHLVLELRVSLHLPGV